MSSGMVPTVPAFPDRHVLVGAGRAGGLGRGRGRPAAARRGGGRPVRRQDVRARDDRAGEDLPARRRGDVHQVSLVSTHPPARSL